MKILREPKIYLYTIIAILLYHVSCITIHYYDKYTNIIGIFSVIISVYLFTKVKYFINKKYITINTLLIIFVIINLISILTNKLDVEKGLFFIIKLCCTFLFFEYVQQIKKEKQVAKIFLILNIIYYALSILFMLTRRDFYIKYGFNYLIGNKFALSYLGLNILFLYSFLYINKGEKSKKNIIIIFIIFLISLYVSITSECTTALLGNIIFIILYLKRIESLTKPRNILIVLLISCCILILFSSILLNISFIQDFIVNVLKKDLSLTGRVDIYRDVLPIINSKIFIGYGYGNSYEILDNLIGAPNTQNALLEWVFYSGILGTLLLILMIYNIFYNLNYLVNSKKEYGFKALVIGIYVYSILGMIEITIGMNYLVLLAMINVGSKKK